MPPKPSRTEQAKLKPPAGLGDAGKRLWKSISGDVAPGWRLDVRDLHLLERACRIEDERERDRPADPCHAASLPT